LLYDYVNKHYHIIASPTGAMAKRSVCGGCVKGCEVTETHKYKHACSDCMTVPPCPFSATMIPCGDVTRRLENWASFDRHKTNKLRGKVICERRRVCSTCDDGISPKVKHECLKKFCANCKKHRETGHLCFMKQLVNNLPRSDNVLFVFYDFETTQEKKSMNSLQNISQIWFACNNSVRNERMKAI
jgi:hypothetical protein